MSHSYISIPHPLLSDLETVQQQPAIAANHQEAARKYAGTITPRRETKIFSSFLQSIFRNKGSMRLRTFLPLPLLHPTSDESIVINSSGEFPQSTESDDGKN